MYKGVELCRFLASGLLLEGLQALIQGSFILVLSHGFGGGVSGVGVVIALGFRTSELEDAKVEGFTVQGCRVG